MLCVSACLPASLPMLIYSMPSWGYLCVCVLHLLSSWGKASGHVTDRPIYLSIYLQTASLVFWVDTGSQVGGRVSRVCGWGGGRWCRGGGVDGGKSEWEKKTKRTREKIEKRTIDLIRAVRHGRNQAYIHTFTNQCTGCRHALRSMPAHVPFSRTSVMVNAGAYTIMYTYTQSQWCPCQFMGEIWYK